MEFFQGEINEVYPHMVQTCAKEGVRVPSRVSDTIELHPVVAEFHNPRQRLVTSYGRAVNVPFALAEVVWILAGRYDVAFLEPFNSRIADYSDDGVTFNAPYGYRLRSAHGHDQLQDVIDLLKRDPGTRQATLTIWHPDDRAHELAHVEGDLQVPSDVGHMVQRPREVKDRACNLLAHLMIRDGKLDWMQVMRSNDAIWGLPYNLMQWTYLHEYIANQVGVQVGVYRHIVDSFHIYDYHEEEAAQIVPFDLYAMTPHRHSPFVVAHNDIEFAQVAAADGWSSRGAVTAPPVSQWVRDFAQIWSSWHCYKAGDDDMAELILSRANDQVYAAATYRFYWTNRWHKQDRDHPSPDRVLSLFGSIVSRWIMSS